MVDEATDKTAEEIEAAIKEDAVGPVPDQWNIKSVAELVADGVLSKIQDGNHGEIHPVSEDYVHSGVPFVMSGDIWHGRVDVRGCKFIRPEHARSLRVGHSKKGDVLLTHKGNELGRSGILRDADYAVLTPQVTYYRVLDQHVLEPEFLRWLFESPRFQHQFKRDAAQSTRPFVSITNQQRLYLSLPPLAEQKAIAAVLGALDDQIELNRRMNSTLEAMARALFQSWFVDFDPVRAKLDGRKPVGLNEATTTLFPSTFHDSPLGPIPHGWTAQRLDYDLSGLLHYIEIGDIALPDIQRPFVWSNAKVRDLFDSMYRGFPVGYFLFWENVTGGATKQIGVGSKQHTVARLLIVDGQQRLTSLFAVFRGRKVLDEDYRERQIEVAFQPRNGKFEVADAAIRRDPEWIANISDLWASRSSSRKLVNDFIAKLAEKAPLSAEDEEVIAHNLDRLIDLLKYPFTALEIASAVDEEQVADIFVRINSEGVRLNQADFILTLMSVFWDEGRMALETFCRHSRHAPSPGGPASPFNHFIQPDPDQLLRVGVAFGFQRGRLKSVYQVLRGKDMDTGEYSPARRDQQFDVLRAAQDEVLDLTHWHQFLSCLIGAGFRSGEMISSQNAMLYAYAFYLVGRKRFCLVEHQLQRLIGRWFFAASLTGRYTSSPETVMDGDLNRLKEVKDAAGFAATLEGIMANELTNDFWTVTLPSNLDSSSARNPELFAYTAAQNRLGAPVLFSHKKISDLLDPSLKTKKKALERHHLFPRAWLEREGVDDLKRINQVGNFALLEWPDNIDISDDSPADYVPKIQPRFSAEEWSRMHEHHALPTGWHTMPYDAFLIERRKLMAAIIRKGFESLK